MHSPIQFSLGATTVSLLRLGALHVRLAEWLGLAEWPPAYAPLFAEPIAVPVQCVHLALPGRSVLVDPCHPELLLHVGEPVPGAEPMPGLLAQLAAAGVDPSVVDTVIITHPHFDHYCGVIAVGATPDADQLLFPNARHLLGRADWDELQSALANPASPAARVFGLLQRHGLVEPVDGPRELGDGLRLLPAPGETPGHQVVRVESLGQVLYVLGDLYHHAAELEQPAWNVTWADPAASAASRAALVAAALAEDALLIAAHIDGVGRVERTEAEVRWVPATLT